MTGKTWGPGLASRTLLSIVILSFLYSFFFLANIQAAEKSITINATGSSAIQGGNAAMARDSAIAEALRNAVEQAVGTIISSETVVESYEVLRDSVYSRTQGYVVNYAVTGEARSGDTYQVTVRANVATGDIEGDLDAMGLLQRKAERPRVLFMIAEKSMESSSYSSWWQSREAIDMPDSEAALKEIFIARGFSVVDTTASAEKKDIAEGYGAADVSSLFARETGKGLQAEVVVFGKASVRQGASAGGTVGTYLADITAEAVRVDDGSVIASAKGYGTSRHISERTGAAEALSKASAELAKGLISQITSKWSGPATVRITLKGADYDDVVEFKRLLKSRVRGIAALYQRSFVEGVAAFEVESRVAAQAIADEISRLEGFRVTGATQNTIEVEAGN
ncbi:MAG TPA: hypothetical protein DDW94_01070 [Deltaproteobacteria bacterium]|nr:MAG: hypothetical protein A2Z79_06435 [Deltaproteobacteria bacterium GWA2_55_82]OGQ63404.1 MAG: hypothetical protein A3I81_03430 [Deltaproteobacteria bacterium RIFCSPLOWO2_02_FULL_55_12]OIJ73182.1 MAG: hypothetical protein A2V21_302225 [Deltaproteobacteria bacterium GWC2_55_46]HBG45562.1 hypothetical protein [Deltaproteobacteria bacterium]HCY10393.1 hypothetical protein [Deltaproteobacteria bacterium]